MSNAADGEKRVAGPDERLVIFSPGIEGLIKIAEEAFVMSNQSYFILDLCPVKYTFKFDVTSSDGVPLVLPIDFVIGPDTDGDTNLTKYAKLLISELDMINNPSKCVRCVLKKLIKGVIEGCIETVCPVIEMKDPKLTEVFKEKMTRYIQRRLNRVGLQIFRVNVHMLQVHSTYIPNVSQKIDELEAKQAKFEMELREGKCPQKEMDPDMKIKLMQNQAEEKKEEVKLSTDVKIYEIQKKGEVEEANAVLVMSEAKTRQNADKIKVLTETKQLEARSSSKAKIDYDTKVLEAKGELYQRQKAAEAALYEQKKKADGDLYAKKKEAEGVIALGEAQATYIRTILHEFGGNYFAMRDFMMIHGGTYVEIEKISGEATARWFYWVVSFFIFICTILALRG